jgi:hypothetical protein
MSGLNASCHVFHQKWHSFQVQRDWLPAIALSLLHLVCACEAPPSTDEPGDQSAAVVPPSVGHDIDVCIGNLDRRIGDGSTHRTIVSDAGVLSAGRIIFVPASWSDGQAAFERDVGDLAAALRADADGIVGRAPELWTIESVFPVGNEPITGAYACRNSSDPGDIVRIDTGTAIALGSAGSKDVIVALVGGTGRAHADHGYAAVNPPFDLVSPPLVVLPLVGDRAAVLEHELGHALLFLADEYGSDPNCSEGLQGGFNTLGDLDAPNLTVNPAGTKFLPLVQGSVPGGFPGYGACTFHPTASCRMNDLAEPFCPVCAAARDDFVAARQGADHAPPLCVIKGGLRDTQAVAVDDLIFLYLNVAAYAPPISARVHLGDKILVDLPRINADHAEFVRIPLTFDDIPDAGELVATCSDAFGVTAITSVHLARAP